MKTYENIKTDADEVTDGAMRYFELQSERLKLELVERLSMSISELIHAMLIGIFVFAGLFMACVVLGLIVQEFANNWLISALSSSALFIAFAWLAVKRGHAVIRDVITQVLIRSIYGTEN